MSSLISFISVLYFSLYSSFVSLGKFIPRYLIFCCNSEWYWFLISLSDYSLLVYRNESDFCVLILYPATLLNSLIQFSSVTQSCLTLCDPMDCSTPGLPVHHQLPELTQTHVHWVNDAIQTSHPLLFPSTALSLSQHQGLFQWVSSSHRVAQVLELQQQSFQWIFRTDFL